MESTAKFYALEGSIFVAGSAIQWLRCDAMTCSESEEAALASTDDMKSMS